MKSPETTSAIEDLSRNMQLLVGVAIVSMATSLSTHHITAVSHGKVPTVADISHMMEREREILHAHSNLGRVRYPIITGGE